MLHALAESLSALPRLSDERDQEQVEGITRLAQVLQVRELGCGALGDAPGGREGIRNGD